MIKKNVLAVLILGLLTLTSPYQTSAVDDLPSGFGIETIAEGLIQPTTAAFTPDGRILIALKNGVVRVVDATGALLPTPLITLTDVNSAEDRGLIGIAVDPDFATNGYVYLAYTYEVDASQGGGYAFDPNLPNCTSTVNDWSDTDCYSIPQKTARVVRVTVQGDTASLGSMQVILGSVGGSPAQPSCLDYPSVNDCIASDSGSHSIGGLRFGPDGKLYVATGDGAGFFRPEQQAFRAQDLDHLSGKILRVNTDGSGPSDNPFYNGNPNDNRSKVYAYGFRNPYRFNFKPGTNEIFGGNVGWFQYEQVNKITAGDNFGWPCYEGGLPATNGYQSMSGCPLTTAQQSDFKAPYYSYAHDANGEGAIAGGTFASSNDYPSFFRDSYVFGDFIFATLSYFSTSSVGPITASDVTTLGSQSSGEMLFPVEFITGPDGLVYFINIGQGELNRIVFSAVNPLAVINHDIVFGSSLTLRFDGSESSIVGNDTLSYAWDFGDGTTTSGVNPTHTYAAAGDYTVSLTVTSSSGYVTTVTKQVTVLPPLYDTDPQITNPSIIVPSGSQNVGNTLTVPTQITNITGTGDDPFRVIYSIKDKNGNEVAQSEHPDIITLGEGQTTTIEHALFLTSIGSFDVSIILRSTDYTRDFDIRNNAFPLDVLSRAPVVSGHPVYRFWSPVYRSHFYTISKAEKESLEQNDPNWTYEGISYQAGKTAQNVLTPVYRFWSPVYRSHFYTISAQEKQSIEQNDPNWNYEGVGWYVYEKTSTDTMGVHRFWSPVYRSHFYTASLAEKQSVEQNDSNWLYEGIGWYIKE